MEDVCKTLIQQNMIFIREPTPPPIRPSPGQSIKFPRGRKNGLARRQLQRLQTQNQETLDSHGSNSAVFVPPKRYEIQFDREKVNEYMSNWERKGYLKLKPDKLKWTPYLTTRTLQEENVPVLAGMDGTVDDSSKATSTQPTTPGCQVDCLTESVVVEEEDELPSVVEGRTWRVKEADIDRPTRSLRASCSPGARVQTPPRGQQFEEAASGMTGRGVLEVDNDEAFAAKLAIEEEMQQNGQLRSGRNERQMRTKSRKRRRIESSPEGWSMEVDREVNGDRSSHTPELTLVDVGLKSEEADTPVTSGQSVPSDDTVSGCAGLKSDERSAILEDEDADGEYEYCEEDAEGEPDPEY